MDIVVKMWTAETLEFSVDPLDAVERLKKSIAEKKGIPLNQQQLFHQGKEMGSGMLSDYGVMKASALYKTCLSMPALNVSSRVRLYTSLPVVLCRYTSSGIAEGLHLVCLGLTQLMQSSRKFKTSGNKAKDCRLWLF